MNNLQPVQDLEFLMSSGTGQEQAFFSSLTVYELFLNMILRTGQEHEFLNCSRTFSKNFLGTNCS